MKQIIFTFFIVAAVGQYFPPWSQYNPFFNGQLPFISKQNFTNNVFGRFPTNNFTSSFLFRPYNPGFRVRRAVNSNYYYQPNYCIPDYHQCNGSHSVSVGCLTSSDKILFRQAFIKPGRWYSSREKIVEYPGMLPPGFVRNETITAIRIQDRYCNGTGGYAQILPGGGVGYKTVRIKLHSTGSGKGFNFFVAIYGR